ncbi:MAG: adenylate/guanylate cyclase domain-containing protein [Deltaproteobacteria bacterium]|nr:MAG: adenylate/guanylate cyclase domain-containing protein [Deltaproteobacteria bacterium]
MAAHLAQQRIRLGPEDEGPTPAASRETEQGPVAGHGELGFDAPGAAEPGEMGAEQTGVRADATEGESDEQRRAAFPRDLVGDVPRRSQSPGRPDEGDVPPARHGRAIGRWPLECNSELARAWRAGTAWSRAVPRMLWAILTVAVLIVLLQVRRSRRTVAALERRLEVASRGLESLQQAFSHFAPAEVVEEIIAQGVSTRSEKKEITVLFADLKGFTALGERLEPEVLVRVLNGYFERMSRAITAHRGHVSKFLGDGILALFGALEANPWQTNDAAHAALAMRTALADYNAALRSEGLPPLAVGVGIHRGSVVAGVIGSAELVEYGVIGRAVNLAARVQTLTRAFAVDVLVTEAVRDVLDQRFRLAPMPATEVKGVPGPLATFAVEAFDPTSDAPARPAGGRQSG